MIRFWAGIVVASVIVFFIGVTVLIVAAWLVENIAGVGK